MGKPTNSLLQRRLKLSLGAGLPQRFGLALVSSTLFIGTSLAMPVLAQDAEAVDCSTSSEEQAPGSTCCPEDDLLVQLDLSSQALAQTFCQLLIFPTASLLNAAEFLDKIDMGSFSDSNAASPDTMTLPSLWWNRDSLTPRLGGNRLVQSWVSYQIQNSPTRVIDVMVNAQIWSVLTYTERYAVLNQFGTAAKSFGYDLRLFRGNARNSRMLGLYVCEVNSGQSDLSTSAVFDSVGTCTANLDPTTIAQLQQTILAAAEQRQQISQQTQNIGLSPLGSRPRP